MIISDDDSSRIYCNNGLSTALVPAIMYLVRTLFLHNNMSVCISYLKFQTCSLLAEKLTADVSN